MGNAIKSTLHGAALKSNNKEGARSIQVEITPTSSRISRNAVTSLSIRGHRWKRHGKTGGLTWSELERSKQSVSTFHGESMNDYGRRAGGIDLFIFHLLSMAVQPLKTTTSCLMCKPSHTDGRAIAPVALSRLAHGKHACFVGFVHLRHTDCNYTLRSETRNASLHVVWCEHET